MERGLILALLLFAVFEIHCQAPTAAAGGFELGHSYSFHYNTTVLLSELRPRTGGWGVKDVGYQILADARCAVIWQHPTDHQQQLLRITVSSPQLFVRSRRAPQPDGFAIHTSRLDGMAPVDVLLLTSSGGRAKLYHQPGREEAETGLARGLVGLLNIRPEGKYRETDASGECDVTYRSEGPGRLVKTKDRCDAATPIHTASHPVLDVSVTSERVTRYWLSAGQLESVTAAERHSVTPAVRAGYGTLVTALQELHITDGGLSSPSITAASPGEALRQLSASLGWEPQETPLITAGTGAGTQCDRESCEKLSDLVSQLRASLTEQSVSSLAAAGAAVALVPALRASSQREVTEVLGDKRNKNIRLSLLDAAGAAQTLPVHTAVRKALGWPRGPSDDIEPHERYLVSLATASHPPKALVKELISESRRKSPSPELHQTVVLTAASLAAAYCDQTGDGDQLCSGLASDLLTQLGACDSSDSADDSSPLCCLLPLRALANLRSETAAPALLQRAMADDSRPECRAEALKALLALPPDLTAPLRPDLERLYGQHDRYDVTSRLLAADILLASPLPSDVNRLLARLENRTASEENTYLLQKIKSAAETHRELGRSLRHLLSDRRVGNYDVLAQGALSSALERKLWGSGGVSAGFSSQLQVAKSKALRRSGFSAQLESQGRRLDVLSFSVETAGLSSLLGSADPEDGPEAQARLRLGLLGRQLRPRRLFSSQGELMGLLWSGAGSERTSALKGTVLLQDHLQEIPLQNGLSARLSVLAAVTFDLAGKIEVSIWNRASQAELDNRAAFLLRGLATVHTPFVRARMEVSQAVEARLDADTDIQFSDGMKSCARISHAPLVLREVVRKQERVPGSRHRLRRVRRRSRTFGGATFSLNRNNADNCRAMFG